MASSCAAQKGRVYYSPLDGYSHLTRFSVSGTSEIKSTSRRLVRSWDTRREKHGRCSMFKTNSEHLAKLQPHAIRCFSRNEPSRIVRNARICEKVTTRAVQESHDAIVTGNATAVRLCPKCRCSG
ncbi:hypothetical protein KC333_g189 [Hortaea werneckii]|nr:hypothetical protein KC333_g189 [Hortaea werneckii]